MLNLQTLALAAACSAAAVAVAQPIQLPGDPAAEPPQQEGEAALAPALPQQMVLKRTTLKFLDMPSHTLLLPDGVTVEGGGFQPGQNYFRNLPSQQIKLRSNSGVEIEIGPRYQLVDIRVNPQFGQAPPEGASVEGNIAMRIPDGDAEWKQFVTRSLREGGATNIKFETFALLRDATEQARRQHRQEMQQFGMPPETGNVAVYEVSVEYDKAGKRVAEYSQFGVTWAVIPDGVGGGRAFWTLNSGFSIRGPADLPDEQALADFSLLALAGSTLQPTQQYMQYVARLDGNLVQGDVAMMKQTNETYRQIFQTNAETGRYVLDNQRESFENQQESNRRMAEKTTNVLTDREDYLIPGTNEYMNLPNAWDHAYYGDDGTVVLTNDADFAQNAGDTNYRPMKVRP